MTELLKAGYLGTVTYGFRRNGNWIEPTLRYTARDLSGASANDDDPGRVRPGANITGATFYSYLTYSPAWDQLTPDRAGCLQEATCPSIGAARPSLASPAISPTTAPTRPGGRALDRASVRSY